MLISSLLLSLLGIAIIFTSSSNLAIQQLIFAVLGLGLFYLISKFDYRVIIPLIKPTYIVILGLLILVFVINIETRGSIRWISLGFINIQPSEFAKIILILSLAHYWSKNLPNWKNIAKSLLILAPFAILIFRQPDLGTTLTILFIYLFMLFGSNISFFKILIISILGLVITPLIWMLMREYQKQRLISFIFPQHDPLGVGYNVIQSTIAVGSGQFWGRGLGRGTQSRLQFLPEFRTDFIFAFIAEELGFVGSLIVLILYLSLFFFFFRILNQSADRFGELIVIGVMGMLFFQIIVNIGMNIGLLPITGITLPLLSYGGSSLLTTLISLGFVASVSKFGINKKQISTIQSI